MTNSETSGGTSYHFKAEIRQLLDILVHSLYKEREIFLRELISNASDALTRMHFEMLTNEDVLNPEAELAIHIDVNEVDDRKLLVVKDSGIGMTQDELVLNLGTIAQSGAKEFLERIQEGETRPADIIGQFGVGFYSVFMVAENVRVVSRSYLKDAEAAQWLSTGGEEFEVGPTDKQERGTEIHILLKKDAEEFANEWQLKQIVKRHSDFVGFPIYVVGERANQQESLWRKPPSDVGEDEYKQFYQQLTMDFEEPLARIHLSSDAPIHVRALLYIPSKREKSVLSLRKEPGVKLFSNNVLIQEYCQDLLPKWLDFVDGVVDSEDLPLNVSRETIQNTRMMRQLGKTLRNRVLRELNDMSASDSGKFGRFWNQYGHKLKEGLATEPDIKEEVLPFFRFYSSESDGNLVSLDEYIERMADEQQDIYYLLGDTRETVALSPHLDPFKARDLEVLFWTDPLDPFIASVLADYRGKEFKNVADAELELPDLPSEKGTEDSDRPDEADFNRLVGRFVTTLGDRIIEVRKSKVLRNSPVRLVSPDEGPARDMQRILRHLDEEYEIPKTILELNRSHPLVANLARVVAERPDDPFIKLAIEQLYEGALVQEGLHPNPAGMLPRVQEILQMASSWAASDGDG